MKSFVKISMLALPLLAMVGCGSNQLSIKMATVSTSPSLDPTKEYKKENRTEEMCTWFLFSIPLGDKSTPAKAFNKLNAGADYVNDLALYPTGWRFYKMGEDTYLIAKSCWNADGVAAIPMGGN
jgi:hypothetical protein